jgi:hypothetical protein
MTFERPMSPPVDPTRRGFLSKAAGVAAGSAVLALAPTSPASAMTLPGVPDPILEAIEGHRAAYAAFDAEIRRHGKLDDELIDAKRSKIKRSETTIVKRDDPRWIESEKEVARTSDAEIDAAIRLVDIRPTTAAGIIALLEYVLLCERRGDDGWPDCLVDENDKPRSWHYFLMENLAAAVQS